MSVVGCIYSGKHLSGICLVGEMSVGDMSGRGSVRRGCVWLGKCSSGMCLFIYLFILSLMLTITEKILFTIKIAVKC